MTSLVPVLVIMGLVFHIGMNFVILVQLNFGLNISLVLDIAGVILGIFLADFFSGFIHWLGDCEIQWKNSILRTFSDLAKLHHRKPQELLRTGSLHIRGNIAFLYAPLLFSAYFLAAAAEMKPVVLMLLTLANLMLLAHTIHKWCHQKSVNRFVALLQKKRIIVGARYHMQHHIPPYSRNFAAINGWSEPLLELLIANHNGKNAS